MRQRRLNRAMALAGVALACIPASTPSASAHKGDEAARPVHVRRLTPEQYKQSIADIFGADITVGGLEAIERADGLIAVGAGRIAITPAAFEQFDANARSIAAQVVDKRHRDYLIPCRPASADKPDDACARRFLGVTGRLVFRRPLDDASLREKVALAHKGTVELGDFYAGLAYALTSLLDAPQFLFISDTIEREANMRGAADLDPFAKAARLSFFLWNTTPDDALLAAAERGELNSAAGLARQVDRLLASPRLSVGMRTFFADMLGFDAFDTLAKDPKIYPAFGQAVVVDAKEQTLRTITTLLLDEQTDYRDLFTTRRTFMSGALGPVYGVPVANPEGWVPYQFPGDAPRAGIVGQLSFVALHAHPGRSSATLRGKAVRELLLCQKVPDPPANVNFALVQDTANPKFRTARQRLTAHRSEPMCAGCHKITDPIGLALENFDGAGQYRAQENGAPIDASADVDGAEVKDAGGLAQALHDNPAVVSCLVNRLYAYGAGHRAGKSAAPWLSELERQFATGGFRLPSLLRRFATDPAFYQGEEDDS